MLIFQVQEIHTSISGRHGDQFINTVMDLYEESHDDITLDFSGIEYLSSIALATIGRLHSQMSDEGKNLTLINLAPQVYQLFELTGLAKLLTLSRQASE